MQRVVALTLTLAILLGTAIVAKADAVVTVGTYNFDAGLASVAIPLFVSNNPQSGTDNTSAGINLNVQIFANPDGSGAVDTNGDGTGTPISPHFVLGTPTGTNSGYVGPGSGPNTGADLLSGQLFDVSSHTAPGDGGHSTAWNVGISMNYNPVTIPNVPTQFATLYISTQGVAPGTTWALNIGGGYFTTNFDNDPPTNEHLNGNYGSAPDGSLANKVPDSGWLDFGDGGLNNTFRTDGFIHINAVPEPSSIVLGVLGALGLAVVVRRKRA